MYDTCMPGARGKNIARISVTMEDQLLADLEALAASDGRDRLQIIRDALKEHLAKHQSPPPTSKKRGSK